MEDKDGMFVTHGVVLSGVILLTNECAKICGEAIPDWKCYLYAALPILATLWMDIHFSEDKEENAFRNCGLENRDKQIPMIIKKVIK